MARFRRLNFGVNSGAEIFHEELKQKIQLIKGVQNIYDDILVYGTDENDHNRALNELLQTLEENNITLNGKKRCFTQTLLKYYGLVFNSRGVSPDPDKVDALCNASRPNSKSEL